MTLEQLQKMKMNLQVDKFTDKVPPEIIAAMPNFNAAYTEFKLLNLKILANLKTQQRNDTGYHADKVQIRKQLIAITLEVSSKFSAYANHINDPALYQTTRCTNRKLTLAPALFCYIDSKSIYDRAVAQRSDLESYGLTSEILTQFEILLAQFKLALPKTRVAISDKKAATLSIKRNFKQSAKLLSTMDGLVSTMLSREPEFHESYFAARKLTKPSFNPLSAKGTVKSASGTPLPFVRLSCLALDLNRIISKNGTFKLFHIPPGDYELIFELPGHHTTAVLLSVFKGAKAELNVTMHELAT